MSKNREWAPPRARNPSEMRIRLWSLAIVAGAGALAFTALYNIGLAVTMQGEIVPPMAAEPGLVGEIAVSSTPGEALAKGVAAGVGTMAVLKGGVSALS